MENTTSISTENEKDSHSSLANADATSANIRVFVRGRPPDDSINSGFISFDDEEDDKVVIQDPEASSPGTKACFRFDRVFWTGTDQETVFDKACKHLVENFLCGHNSCCLVYGQTGSGKTYNMFGAEDGDLRGFIPRSIEMLFDKFRSEKSKIITLSCSFLEIYNDQIHDLGKSYLTSKNGSQSSSREGSPRKHSRASILYEATEQRRRSSMFVGSGATSRFDNVESPMTDVRQAQDDYQNTNHEIQEDADGNVVVSDLSIIPISRAEDAITVITIGAKMRAVSESKLNQVSSRAHTVFSLFLSQRDRDSPETTTSVLHLVDLAGSERLKKSESQGIRLREALHINTSLGSLGKVLSGITEGSHIHYRDSKLTRLLQTSLTSKSQISFIATIHPVASCHEECLATLQFASRCRGKQRGASNAAGDDDSEKDKRFRKMRDELSSLRAKVSSLERVNASYGLGPGSTPAWSGTFPMFKVVRLLEMAGIGASIASDGSLSLDDGRIIPADELDLSMEPSNQRSTAILEETTAPKSVSSTLLARRSSMNANAAMNSMATALANAVHETKLRKNLTDAQADNDALRAKLKERKLLIEQLSAQLKDATYQLTSSSNAAEHMEHELRHTLADAEHQRKELQKSLESRHAEEKAQILRHNEELVKEKLRLMQSIPSNLRTFTHSVREHDDINKHNDIMLQRKYDKRWQQCEHSHVNELANLKLQYEHWMSVKNKELVQFKDKFNQYKGRKTHQLKICEREIVLLYEYAVKLEDILKQAEKGNYSVQQPAAAEGVPVTGLYETSDFNSTGPLRLGGILLPRGCRPVNPLDPSALGEPLSLCKKLVKKARETNAKLKQMKEEAFEKSLGLTPVSADDEGPLEEVLQRKIQSLFVNKEHFVSPVGPGPGTDAAATGKAVGGLKESSLSNTDTPLQPQSTGAGAVAGPGLAAARRVSMKPTQLPPRPRTSHDLTRRESAQLKGVAKGPTDLLAEAEAAVRPVTSLGGVSRRSSGHTPMATVSFVTEASSESKAESEQLRSQLVVMQEELDELRARDEERQLELREVLQELEGNDTLEYINYLEANQERLQAQLKEANAQIQYGKVTNASLVRLSQKQDNKGRITTSHA